MKIDNKKMGIMAGLLIMSAFVAIDKVPKNILGQRESIKRKLIPAVQENDLPTMRILLKDAADVGMAPADFDDVRDGLGRTTLMLAVLNDNTQIAKMLLDHGANPDLQGKTTGSTPLMMAASSNNLDMIDLLLSYKANTKLLDKKGRSAYAIARQEHNTKAIERLAVFEEQAPKTNNNVQQPIVIIQPPTPQQ